MTYSMSQNFKLWKLHLTTSFDIYFSNFNTSYDKILLTIVLTTLPTKQLVLMASFRL